MTILRSATLVTLALLLSPDWAGAQTAVTALSLEQTISLAYTQGPDLASAQTTLQNAQVTATATKADPSALVGTLTQTQQAADLARVDLASTRLTIMQNVANAYLTLYETRQNVALVGAQLALDRRNSQIARAKLAAGNATSLDVSKAQNVVDTDVQNLANATAQLSVQSAQLAKLFGQSATQVAPQAPPAPPAVKASLASLGGGLTRRLPSVVQAQQQVDLEQLNVKLADNAYTAKLTLQTAQTTLENARRTLANAQKSAVTSLNAAYSTAEDSEKRVALARAAVQSAQTALNQSQARLKSGVASQVDVQTSQVSRQSAQYALTQAIDAQWKALAALSVAAGVDVTGLTGEGDNA